MDEADRALKTALVILEAAPCRSTAVELTHGLLAG